MASAWLEGLASNFRLAALVISHRWSCDYYDWLHADELPEKERYFPPPAMWVLRPEFAWGWLFYRIDMSIVRRQNRKKQRAR